MPIEVFCEPCQKKLRVPDTAAGKRIKCPKCQSVISVPAADAGSGAAASSIPTPAKVAATAKTTAPTTTPTTTPKPTTSAKVAAKPVEKWFVQTEDGEQYGPVTREELDAWHAEGRVTADTQLLLEGGAQWQWATDVYPDLAPADAPATTENGFPSFGDPATSAPASGGEFNFNAGTGASATPSTTTTTKTATKGKKSVKGKKAGKKAPPEEVGDKSKMVAGLLGVFLGAWGVHNFYLGFTKKAIIQIVVTIFTCGIGGLWGFVEGIMVFAGSIDRDADGLGLKP